MAVYKATITMTLEGPPENEEFIRKSLEGVAEQELIIYDLGPADQVTTVEGVTVSVEQKEA